MNGKEEHYPDYPLFKGLQRPLEFMGIQGRYIYWAAATIGIAIVGFIIAYCMAGFVLALIVLSVTVTSGVGLILFKQRKGLHSKRLERGGVHLCLLKENVTENHLTMNGYIEC